MDQINVFGMCTLSLSAYMSERSFQEESAEWTRACGCLFLGLNAVGQVFVSAVEKGCAFLAEFPLVTGAWITGMSMLL